jgi:hypothetical protein
MELHHNSATTARTCQLPICSAVHLTLTCVSQQLVLQTTPT